MSWPSVVTTFTNPNATDKLNLPSHSSIESAQNNGLTEVQTFVGTLSSAVGTLVYDIRAAASNGGGHVQSANKGGTGQTAYAKGDLLVASSSSVLSKLAVGNDNQVLIADSTQSSGVKWSASGSTVIRTLDFSVPARLTQSSVNSGTRTAQVWGEQIVTGTTSGSAASDTWRIAANNAALAFAQSPVFTCTFDAVTPPLTGEAFIGIGQPTVDGTGHTFTDNHIGFKILSASSIQSLYATQADGVTENASSVIATLVNGDAMELLLKVNGTSSVDYQYRKNGSVLSTTINLTSNMPAFTTSQNSCQFSVSNKSTTGNMKLNLVSASYSR